MSWKKLPIIDPTFIKEKLVEANFEGAKLTLLLIQIPAGWYERGFWTGEKLPPKKPEFLVRLLVDGRFYGHDLTCNGDTDARAVFLSIKADPRLHPVYRYWREEVEYDNAQMAEVL